ncbi:MAG: hypothetical protein WD469_12155 [Paenibacillaceae bacterium]
MKINLKFSAKGQIAIKNFENDEILEIFTRYSNTLKKKYMVDVNVPADINQRIIEDGILTMILENVECDIETFYRELGRDIKVPLKKRFDGKLDNLFKIEVMEN